MRNKQPEGGMVPFVPKGPRIGFVYEAFGMMLVVFLLSIISPAQQSCSLGRAACLGWRVGITILSIILMSVNILAISHFLKIPHNSVPPEKIVGVGFGVLGVSAGFLVAVSSIIGAFF